MVDARGFEDFCRAEYATVFRATLAFSGSREIAQDSTQEAFARAFARWRRLSTQPWAGGWVMTTALNLCRRALRRTPETSATADPAPPADSELQIDVLDALRDLPLRQRQAILLYYLADLPVAAVAELMNASEGSVKTHLSRARKSLGTRLAPIHGGGEP